MRLPKPLHPDLPNVLTKYRDSPDYATILVYHELYGGRTNDVFWISCPSMAVHDLLAQLFRKIHVNYRTEKLKTRSGPQFTIYFQAFPDTFTSYTVKDVLCAYAILIHWAKNTEKTYQDKYIARTPGQVRVLQEALTVSGLAYRTISRPVRWGGSTIVSGFMITSDGDIMSDWKVDRQKAFAGEILHKMTEVQQ